MYLPEGFLQVMGGDRSELLQIMVTDLQGFVQLLQLAGAFGDLFFQYLFGAGYFFAGLLPCGKVEHGAQQPVGGPGVIVEDISSVQNESIPAVLFQETIFSAPLALMG